MPLSDYSTDRDTNASIAPGNIRVKDPELQQVVNSIRQLMVDLAALGITSFIEGLLNDANAVAALATLGITTGTWTPTLTNVSNVAAFTAQVGQYIRVGDTVICMCSEGVDPTLAAPTATSFRMSLPVASNFANTLDAVGLSSNRISTGGGISANAATDDVTVLYNATITTIDFINCFFMYKVLL